MDVEKILLTFGERLLLRRIEVFGYAYNEKTKKLKRMDVLSHYHLIQPCYDKRFPSAGNDLYGNPSMNAYKVDKLLVSRYRLYLREKFWPEFRDWIAIGISLAALVISAISLLMQLHPQ